MLPDFSLKLPLIAAAFLFAGASAPRTPSNLPHPATHDRLPPEFPNQPYRPPDEPQITSGTGEEITIEGRLFFNDRRETGIFGVRLDPDGHPVKECDPDGLRDKDPSGKEELCWLNWAGAQMVVVDAIERDSTEFPTHKPIPNAPKELTNCLYEDVLGSDTVRKSGRYSITFKPRDGCGLDDFGKYAIEIRFRLRFCNESFCFSMRKAGGDVYTLSHGDASHDKPIRLARGDRLRLPDRFFKTERNGSNPEFISVAANYYATIVDTLVAVHRDMGIPFFGDQFGEIEYIYPADGLTGHLNTSTATTKSPRTVVIDTFEDGCDKCAIPVWPAGQTPAHEYGHVMMLRAWGGEYGFDGIGKHFDERISGRAADPAPQIAFKEAWANFLVHAVFAENNGFGCEYTKIEDNVSNPPLGNAQTGIEFIINNEKALCDWFDSENDGADNFQQNSFKLMWDVLRGLHKDRGRFVMAYPTKGLSICDFGSHYQTVGPRNGSVSNPNSGLRPGLTWEGQVLSHNLISCPNVR